MSIADSATGSKASSKGIAHAKRMKPVIEQHQKRKANETISDINEREDSNDSQQGDQPN